MMRFLGAALLCAVGLASCKVTGGSVNYTRQEMLSSVTAKLTRERGFTQINCENNFTRVVVGACYVTNLPPVDIDVFVKADEISGVTLLDDWRETGKTLAKYYEYRNQDDQNYTIGLLYFSIEERKDKAYVGLNEKGTLEIYVDESN
ncbi:hypothetical protein [Deinococcus sp.]|uniref:hypothetical protein n=1 Tax=Deinococcus sp. TaxID=47478 RepID=UPI003B59BC3B